MRKYKVYKGRGGDENQALSNLEDSIAADNRRWLIESYIGGVSVVFTGDHLRLWYAFQAVMYDDGKDAVQP